MAKPKPVSFLFRLEWWMFRALIGVFRALSVDCASDVGAAFVKLVGPLTSAQKAAKRNLALAFPQMPKRERAVLLAKVWENIGRIGGEFAHPDALRATGPDPRIKVINPQALEAIKASGKGVVFISGHFANWEAMPAAIAQLGVPCRMTYRPSNNPLIDAWIQESRKAYGAQMQAPKNLEGGMALLRALKSGQSVALMNDQKYNEGIEMPFFGVPAFTHDGPTRLAIKFGVDLVPVSLTRTHKARFEMRIHPALPLKRDLPFEEAVRDGVAQVNAWVEEQVRARPQDWFWVHRRWPKSAWSDLPRQ